MAMLVARSSCPELFCEKGVLRNFAKFTGKHLCQCLFFNKVEGLRSATLLKKRLWCKCFPVNSAKFVRTLFFKEHLRWLLLDNLSEICIDVLKKHCQRKQIFERTLSFQKILLKLEVY